ncbi:hypothetical protein HC776_01575 [bacterium]|nr:hypothetical protein [bacterium]
MKRWVSLLFGMIGMMLGVSRGAAQTGNIVEPNNVFVRSGPSETYIAIGALFPGETVTPVNRSADNTWILVCMGVTTGWIERTDVTWQTDLSTLPVLAPDITPTARATQPLRLLSPTPSTAQGFVLVNDGSQALVRSGPLRGFPLLGRLAAGSLVDPVSRSAEGDWIMIRYRDDASNFDGFGWIARDLVQWRDESLIEALPIIDANNLTPTSTEDASIVLASATAVPISSATPLATTPAPTNTNQPTATETPVPTVTLNLPTATTSQPSDTPMPPSNTPGLPTNTPELPTETTAIHRPKRHRSAPRALPPRRIALSPRPMTATPTVPTETPLPTLTRVPLETPAPTETGSSPLVPLVALAGVTVAVGLVYLGAFARAMPELRRYEQGFVRADCPVCERGSLVMEEKRSSTFGIPAVRRTVRCNTCRSVLREKAHSAGHTR